MSASEIRELVETAWRDYEVDGLPASGPHEPEKALIRRGLGELLETTLGSVGLGIARFETVALMDADTDSADGALAYVYRNAGDPGDAANGIYQWDDGGSAWEPAEWYFNALNALVEDMAADILATAPYSGGMPGDIFTINGEGERVYEERLALARQVVPSMDPSDSDNYRLGRSSGASAATATPQGSDPTLLRLKRTGTTGSFNVFETMVKAQVGSVSRFTGQLVNAPAGAVWGFVCAILPTEPVLGGSLHDLPSTTPLIVATGSSGLLQLLTPAAGLYPDVTINLGGGGNTWTTGLIEIEIEPLDSGQLRAAFSIDGDNRFERVWTENSPGALVAEGYLCPGIRFINTGDEGDLSAPETYLPSLPMVSRLQIMGTSPPGGNGTERSPFETVGDAVKGYEFDQSRGELDLLLKGGILAQAIYPGSLPFNTSKVRDMSVRSTTGTMAIIDATTAVTPTWTLIAGTTEFWRTPSPPYLGGNAGHGGFIEVDDAVSQTFGLNGFQTVEGLRLYCLHANNLSTASGLFIRGGQSKHTTGEHAGYTIIRCWDGGDPNELTLRYSQYAGCILGTPGDQDGWNGCRLRVENIEMFGGFTYGLYADRAMVQIRNVKCRGIVIGFPFELNHCGGEMYDPFAEAFTGDALHSGGGGTLPLVPAYPSLHIWNLIARGGSNFVNTANSSVADGASNHGAPTWHFHGGEISGVGKSCLATFGNIIAEGMTLQGAVDSGITMAQDGPGMAAYGSHRICDFRDMTIRKNGEGIRLEVAASASGGHSEMTVDNMRFIDNVLSSMHIKNNGIGGFLAEIHYDPATMRYRTTGVNPNPTHGDLWNEVGGTFDAASNRAPV